MKKNEEKSIEKNTFTPVLDDVHHICFSTENAEKGFAELMKGGKFVALEAYYVVSNKHIELLKTAKLNYKIVN